MAGMAAGTFARFLTSTCSAMQSLTLRSCRNQSYLRCFLTRQSASWPRGQLAPARMSLSKFVTTSCGHTSGPSWPSKSNSTMTGTRSIYTSGIITPGKPLLQPSLNNSHHHQQVRTRIKFSYETGEALTVKPVLRRFYRLNNGMWIRARAGRRKYRWRKSARQIHRLKQHVFLNKTQCRLMDNMVNKEYRTPTYFVRDPYEHYQKKSNLPYYRYKPPPFFPL